LDPDSDNDNILDGTEFGLTQPQSQFFTDLNKGFFAPDLDPTTTTSMILEDTDGDGLQDGVEDYVPGGSYNYNGRVDAGGETDPNLLDSDGDLIPDYDEVTHGLDPSDVDTDDDGVMDGEELLWDQDLDNDGNKVNYAYKGFASLAFNYDSGINALDTDSDGDGLDDSIEYSVTDANGIPASSPYAGTDVTIPYIDTDITQNTDPVNPDTDGDGLIDGLEDLNDNGHFDADYVEPNPLDPDTDKDGLLDGDEAARPHMEPATSIMTPTTTG